MRLALPIRCGIRQGELQLTRFWIRWYTRGYKASSLCQWCALAVDWCSYRALIRKEILWAPPKHSVLSLK
jgi:hypothetical protein